MNQDDTQVVYSIQSIQFALHEPGSELLLEIDGFGRTIILSVGDQTWSFGMTTIKNISIPGLMQFFHPNQRDKMVRVLNQRGCLTPFGLDFCVCDVSDECLVRDIMLS